MNNKTVSLISLLFFLTVFTATHLLHCSSAVAEQLRAAGYGLAPKKQGLSQAERYLSGIRAARNDALRNLAEKIQVQVTAQSTLEGFTLTNDQVKIKVDMILRNTRTVSEQRLADGRYRIELETNI